MKLLVVESPNKTHKIKSILGAGWEVVASVGHIRDLPKHDMGLAAPSFALQYEFIPPSKFKGRLFPGGAERVARISALAQRAEIVYLATDLDREGEAIAWHLAESLKLKDRDYERVTFSEITAPVIRAAIANTRKIDYNLVRAQEARRALDRIVGYLVSPLISNMLGQNLSAGRVQSVAVRLVVDLERRISAFRATKHFGAQVKFDAGTWKAEWDTRPFTTPESPYVLDESLATQAAACRHFEVMESKTDIQLQPPPPCFSTSLLLQAASAALKMDPEVTAKLAQKLFEAGAITYIRVDTVNISEEAIEEIRSFATTKGWPLPPTARKFHTRSTAHGAHEAIRPTDISIGFAGEDDDQRRLYRLIWQRTVASQLADAKYRVNALTLKATDCVQPLRFKAKGRTLLEPGWRTLTSRDAIDEGVHDEADSAGQVPLLAVGNTKHAEIGELLRKTTKPPLRYTKATLIKKLEEEGIGRPATYAAILSNVMSRSYLEENTQRHLSPTETGSAIVDRLVKAGFGFMQLAFTRELEGQLDGIAEGAIAYLDVVGKAYEQLNREVKIALETGQGAPRFACPQCSSALRRSHKAGTSPVWYCTSSDCKTYMDDDNGKPVAPKVHPCPTCREALRRYQRKNKGTGRPIPNAFGWFCTRTECDTFLDDENGVPVERQRFPCPLCERPMHRRSGRYGYWWGCSGFKEGCSCAMDDKNGKPVPKSSTREPAGMSTESRISNGARSKHG